MPAPRSATSNRTCSPWHSMRRSIAYPLAALGAIGSTLVVATPALAHGYVSAPPSRQALCASGAVADCGQIQFEPQSVEGPKGLKSCDGGVAQFSVLSDNSRKMLAHGLRLGGPCSSSAATTSIAATNRRWC